MTSVKLLSQNSEIESLFKDDILIMGRSEKLKKFTPFVYSQFLEKQWKVGHDFTGQWWFILQDKATGKIKLIRDKNSYTSLFFSLYENSLYISEDIKDILQIKKFEINKKAIATLMVLNIKKIPTDTYFEGIFSLPAGYEMTFESSIPIIGRYWFPEKTPKLNYSDLQRYSKEYSEMFQNAVSANIEKYNKVATMLSGGLDSSSVTSLAAKFSQKKSSSIASFTHVPLYEGQYKDRENNFGDESKLANEVLKKYKNIKGEFIKSEDISPIEGINKIVEYGATLIHGAANAYWLIDLYQKVQHGKYDVLLTGENGNGTFSYTGNRLTLNWKHEFYKKNYKRLVIDKIYWPIKNLFYDTNSSSFEIGFHFLNEKTIEDLELEKFYFKPDERPKRERDNTNFNRDMIFEVGRRVRMPIGGQLANHFGFKMVDPTATEEMIEYAYSMPNEVYFGKNGMTRNLIREMMIGDLPEKVRLETKIGQQSSDVTARLQHAHKEVEETLAIVSKNTTFRYLFDLKKVNEFWLQTKNNDPKNAHLHEVNSFLKVLMAGLLIDKYN